MKATRKIILFTIFLSLTTTQVVSMNLAFNDGFDIDNLATNEKLDKVSSETSQFKGAESAKEWKLLPEVIRVERVETPKNEATSRFEEEERKLNKLTRTTERETLRDQYAPLRRLKDVLSQYYAKREHIPRRCRCYAAWVTCSCRYGRSQELPQENVVRF